MFGFQNEGPVDAWPGIRVRQEDWSPPQNSRVEDVGRIMPHSLGSLHFSPLTHPQQTVYIPPARAANYGDILPGGLSWRKMCLNVAQTAVLGG